MYKYSLVFKSFPINKFNFDLFCILLMFDLNFFLLLEIILIKNVLNKKCEKIILEKIYVKIEQYFMYFHNIGFCVHISNGCIP